MNVFVASAKKFAKVEPIMKACLLDNCSDPDAVSVEIIRPTDHGMQPTGCTGFTNVRYAVPELCRDRGLDWGVYLDVDMMVVGDILELEQYYRPGYWSQLRDGSSEVAVACSTCRFPGKGSIHLRHKSMLGNWVDMTNVIPLVWNCEDYYIPGESKIVHYTALAYQPWFHNHYGNAATDLWETLEEKYG